MTIKMGESQVIDFFSATLRDGIRNKSGAQTPYSLGNFSGSQDRKFADVFAGTASRCILIEFKELEAEIKHEVAKPLRKKLCEALTSTEAARSRITHFIAYAGPGDIVNVRVAPYIDVVCTRFGVGCPPLEPPMAQSHDKFIDDFLSERGGATHEEFLGYIGHLNATAGGTADGSQAPFRSILFSRSKEGKVIGTRFENLSGLHMLLKLKPTSSKRPKP